MQEQLTRDANPPSPGPAGWEKAKDEALWCWMQDVTSLLCYQPEVPMDHKERLCAALSRYTECRANLQASLSPNTPAHRPGAKTKD